MNRKNTIFLIVIFLTGILTFSNIENVNAQEKGNVIDTNIALFDNGVIEPIHKLSNTRMTSDTFDINYKNNTLKLSLNISNELKEEKMMFTLDLYPNNLEQYGKSVIGVQSNSSDNYEIVSFRLENEANSITLMAPNLHLEDATVLSLGVRDKRDNNIYYLQQEFRDIEFDSLFYNEVNNQNLAEDKIEDIELEYMRLKTDNDTTPQKFNANTVNFHSNSSEYTSEHRDDSEKKATISPMGSLFPHLNDNIFKSGPLSEWQHNTGTINGSDDGYAYSYITWLFAGTENRETYIVYLDWFNHIDWNSFVFTSTLRVVDNITVMYNVHNDTVDQWTDNNRMRVNDASLHHNSNTEDAFFWAREHQNISTGSILPNILRATISLVPYAGQGQSFLETLTDSNVTENGTFMQFPATAEGQLARYNGVIQEIEIVSDGVLRSPNDELVLKSYADISMGSMNYGFSYDVEYR